MDKDIQELLSTATTKLKHSDSQTPQLDAEVLLAHALKKPREYILAHPEKSLTKLKIENFKLKIARRSLGEPVAYITGQKEFYGLDFFVNKNVLIPRPETELIVDKALTLIKNSAETATKKTEKRKEMQSFDISIYRYIERLKNNTKGVTVIDVGTGSGCIIVSSAYNIQHTTRNKIDFFGTDTSSQVLNVAKKNARSHKVEKNIIFLQGNLLDPILKSKIVNQKSSILILANLPYLSKKIYKTSPFPVKNYEPQKALASGMDGLDHYRELFGQIETLVTDYKLRITALCEISPEQKNIFKKEIKTLFPSPKISFFKDLSGKWRLAKCVLK